MLEIHAQSVALHRLCWTVWTFDTSADVPVSNTETAENKDGTDPFTLLSFCRLSFVITCPQVIIIGGFCSVDWSFETGHAKIE